MSYTPKEIIWAKPVGYPWWPALVSKLPQNNDGNFKVLFIGEDNFAILDPKSIRKYEQYYQQLSKNKTKKLQIAIAKADQMLKNKKANEPKNKKKVIAIKAAKKEQKKKASKKEEEREEKYNSRFENEDNENKKYIESNIYPELKSRDLDAEKSEISVSEQESQNDDKRKDASISPIGLSDEYSLEKEANEVNRQKIQKVEGELNKIIVDFQSNRINEWTHSQYFKQFDCEFLTCEELLQSNLTRMIRFIIVKMEELEFSPEDIRPLETLSEELKKRIYEYLANTSYYDQYLRAFDKNKQHQAQAEALIVKIIKKQNHGLNNSLTTHNKMKKQNISLFADLIGQQIGKGGIFRAKQFIQDLKENKYELHTKLTSKAATQRFSEFIIKKYI